MIYAKWIAFLAALLPFLALHLSFISSAKEGLIEWCLPYFDGCSSISKASRQGNALFIFRALMMPYTVIMIFYWIAAYYWLILLGDKESKKPLVMLILGIFGSLALILYIDFLGTHGSAYRLMRRYGITFFFSLTGFAQFILVSSIFRLNLDLSSSLYKIRNYMLAICLKMLFLALCQMSVSLMIVQSDIYDNIIEWNYGLLLILFGIASYFAWGKTNFKINFTI